MDTAWRKRERMRTFRYRSALKKENISIIFYYFQHDRFWDFNHEFLLLTEIKITLMKMRAETFSTNSRPLNTHILALPSNQQECQYKFTLNVNMWLEIMTNRLKNGIKKRLWWIMKNLIQHPAVRRNFWVDWISWRRELGKRQRVSNFWAYSRVIKSSFTS